MSRRVVFEPPMTSRRFQAIAGIVRFDEHLGLVQYLGGFVAHLVDLDDAVATVCGRRLDRAVPLTASLSLCAECARVAGVSR